MAIPVKDQELAALLAAAMGVQEVRGPDGRLLGRFTPEPRPGVSVPESGMTDAELAHILDDPKTVWVSPERVMERLGEIDRCSP